MAVTKFFYIAIAMLVTVSLGASPKPRESVVREIATIYACGVPNDENFSDWDQLLFDTLIVRYGATFDEFTEGARKVGLKWHDSAQSRKDFKKKTAVARKEL